MEQRNASTAGAVFISCFSQEKPHVFASWRIQEIIKVMQKKKSAAPEVSPSSLQQTITKPQIAYKKKKKKRAKVFKILSSQNSRDTTGKKKKRIDEEKTNPTFV